MTPKLLISQKQINDCDLIITNNIKFFSTRQIEWMLEQPNRVRYEHDYWNLVNPEHEQYKKEMWEGGLKSIFLSPAHKTEYGKQHSAICFPSVCYQPSPIKVNQFTPAIKKDPVCIYVGAIEPHKGVWEAAEYVRKRGIPLIVYGTASSTSYFDKVSCHPSVIFGGTLPYERVIKVMAKADMFIHIPNWVEPYGRTVIEARLSGCRCIFNDRVGAASYSWWDKSVDELKQFWDTRDKAFWEIIDEL